MPERNQALFVHTKAEQRFNNGTATKVDEVVLALWDENKELSEKIRQLVLKISMLEMKNGATVKASTEYAAILQRMCQVNKAPLVQGG